jgi:hypothetical protein
MPLQESKFFGIESDLRRDLIAALPGAEAWRMAVSLAPLHRTSRNRWQMLEKLLTTDKQSHETETVPTAAILFMVWGLSIGYNHHYWIITTNDH